MTLTQEELTAYHEAGHVYVAYRLGRRIDRVSLDCAFEGNPAAFIEGGRPSLGEIQLALAGAVSECLAADLRGGLESGDRTIMGAHGDTSHAQAIAEIIFPGGVGAVVEQQLTLLDAEFRKASTRRMVDALVVRLLDGRTLTGDEAIAAMLESPNVSRARLWSLIRSLWPCSFM